ncbi:MAG: hypothetical protein N3F63_01250 [Thermoplasmata archaeon]|nr:hypothetical protein [Thermoplasmata archaeon]
MEPNHHLLRRAVHIIGLQLTLIYYLIPSTLFFSPLDKNYAMLVSLICVMEFEYIRVTRNWEIPGIRPYERYRFSAVFWSAVGLFVCYLMCPYFVGIPIVVAAAWVDPLMGELRRKNYGFSWVLGFTVYFLIMFLLLVSISPLSLLHTGLVSLVAAAIGIICETWKNYYLDDNFLLLTFPAIGVMCLVTFLL